MNFNEENEKCVCSYNANNSIVTSFPSYTSGCCTHLHTYISRQPAGTADNNNATERRIREFVSIIPG